MIKKLIFLALLWLPVQGFAQSYHYVYTDSLIYIINTGGTDTLLIVKHPVTIPDNYVLTYDLATNTASWEAAPGASGGEANTYSSAGGTESIIKTKTGVDLPHKGLTAGTNITLSSDANSITINSSGGGSGDTTFVKESGVAVGDTVKPKFDFQAGFDVTETPLGEFNISLDLTEKQVNLATEVTGTLPDANVANNITVSDNWTDTENTAAAYLPKATFADSLRNAFRTGAQSGTPASGDTLLAMIGGVITRVDIGNLPTGGGGEANTISSQGSGGIGLTATTAKSGVDLRVRSISSYQFLTNADSIGLNISNVEGLINHDNLLGFVAGEHFLQSAISITESQVSDLSHTTDTFVTNKDSHDHLGGDGAQIQHSSLGGVTANQHHTPTAKDSTYIVVSVDSIKNLNNIATTNIIVSGDTLQADDVVQMKKGIVVDTNPYFNFNRSSVITTIGTDPEGSFLVFFGGAYRLTMLSSGFTGIGLGATDPTQMLDVGGNIAVSGTVDGTDISVHVANANAHHTPTVDTNTQLSQEQVEDFAGALVTDGTGTHTGITITYQDATGDIDIVTDVLQSEVDAKEGTLTNSAGLRAALSDESGTGVFLTTNGDGSSLTGIASSLTVGESDGTPTATADTLRFSGDFIQTDPSNGDALISLNVNGIRNAPWGYTLIDTVKNKDSVVVFVNTPQAINLDSTTWQAEDSTYVTLYHKTSYNAATKTKMKGFWVTSTETVISTFTVSTVPAGSWMIAITDSVGGRDAGAGVNWITGSVHTRQPAGKYVEKIIFSGPWQNPSAVTDTLRFWRNTLGSTVTIDSVVNVADFSGYSFSLYKRAPGTALTLIDAITGSAVDSGGLEYNHTETTMTVATIEQGYGLYLHTSSDAANWFEFEVHYHFE